MLQWYQEGTKGLSPTNQLLNFLLVSNLNISNDLIETVHHGAPLRVRIVSYSSWCLVALWDSMARNLLDYNRSIEINVIERKTLSLHVI
jgi:hypothetical protein